MTNEAKLEGILFAMGGPVEAGLLAEALELETGALRELAASLGEELKAQQRGVRLLHLEDSYQLCSAEDCYEALIRIAKKPKAPVLTDVVMETLAIIAYKQPVTKGEIERIRGVSSDHAVNRLVEYGLVEEQGRQNAPGRPILFGTTDEFLRRFRLETAEALPVPDAGRLARIAEEVEEETGEKLPVEI